jgi:oxygen-independent coproporphyrinogen-3 oxidase
VAPLPHLAPIGVYIHIPFCAHICPYCDFNTYAGQESLIPAYVDAVCTDLDRAASEIGPHIVSSIFLGGGTPSVLSPDHVERIVATVRSVLTVAADAEVTLEANPNGLSGEYLAGLRRASVNRLSIGLQTTDRRGLRRLGRMHEADHAEQAVISAAAAGFERISIDLIFGWPGQSPESWRTDLEAVSQWAKGAVDHLSLYSLIVEPGTPLADAVQRGIVTVLDDDAAADLYEYAIAYLAESGWSHYEVSNWARLAGGESVHNRIYWRNGEYLGVGAGAHGRIGNRRTMRHLLPATYLDAVQADKSTESNREELSGVTQQGETMMLGLRLLQEGVSFAEFRARHGVDLLVHYGDVVRKFRQQDLLVVDAERIRLSPRGLLLANDICAAFLP